MTEQKPLQEKGFLESAMDAASSAASTVSNATADLKDRVTHMGAAASEKTQQGAAAANKEADKQIVKDSNAGIGDRLKAAGGVVSNTVDEKSHELQYEKEKKQATS